MIVGQNDEAALAMMIMGALGIAAQHPPAGPQACRFYLLDGSPVDSALSGQLGRLKDILPHPVTNVTWRDLATTFGGLAEEMKRRQESTSDDQAPIYILIYDVQRFRDLRKSDDDFGYSRYDEDKPAPPSKLFGDVLRDGPPVGIHTIIWCDSVNNMNRTLDRQGMKEFENRILFQMSANDSSTLIDTPGGQQAGRKPGALLQRGRKPDREVPALRNSRGGLARERQRAVRGPSETRGQRSGRRRRQAGTTARVRLAAHAASVAEPTEATATPTVKGMGRRAWRRIATRIRASAGRGSLRH